MNVMQPVDRIRGGVHEKERHESGHKHVSGTAEYIDDIPEPQGTLHGYLGLSQRAHAEILSIDFEAVSSSEGVIGVLTAADIPGENDISPAHKHDDSCSTASEVEILRCLECALLFETGISDSGSDGLARCPQCGLTNAGAAVADAGEFVLRHSSRFR